MRAKKQIKADLAAELDKDVPDEGRVSELAAELKRARGGRPRLRRRGREGDGDRGSRPNEVDPDAEAIKSWPRELRARLGGSPYSRVIDGRPVDDPGGHGQRNDAHRWSPWR
ncbi:hypothetical protein ACIRVK_45170 [Streptomyces sp. NPDC101152]|uniref:hypothetical protein n=1 Tax=Streptomyces sp. NPDC101152 TaxID=3366116 RepID=UPI00381CF78A